MGGDRARRLLAAACLLLVAGACGDNGRGDQPRAGSTASTGSGTGSPSVEVADPDRAVAPPGPLKEGVLPADVLIFNDEPLSKSIVDRVRRIDVVADIEVFGLANVAIENRAINLAAVDPDSFRRFTPTTTAQLQEAWERVAGGELAIGKKLGERLQDDEGEVKLGGDKDAPEIHIGAYAPQTVQIDAVVNRKVGEELDMVFGNAMLISTGRAAPEVLRKPLERIVGDNASVQNLDIAARLGLDPNATQTAYLTGGSVADVVGTFNYTVLGGGRIAPEPSWVSSHIGTEVMPIIGAMTCNRAIFPQLRAALEEVVARGLADELHPDEYAGCYYPRFIAGTTTLSNHSFGLAMDFNVPGNQRGTVGEMDRGIVAIFKKWGFAWGGDWNYTDPMHFEMNAVVDAR